MNKYDLNKIEDDLNIKLPNFYKQTMLHYPFPNDSFAEELLMNNADMVIEQNQDSNFAKGKFFIGHDGGEERYFLKLNNDEKVYVWDLELNKERIESNTWKDYLKNVQDVLDEIIEDERNMKEIKKNKKWWQFWI